MERSETASLPANNYRIRNGAATRAPSVESVAAIAVPTSFIAHPHSTNGRHRWLIAIGFAPGQTTSYEFSISVGGVEEASERSGVEHSRARHLPMYASIPPLFRRYRSLLQSVVVWKNMTGLLIETLCGVTNRVCAMSPWLNSTILNLVPDPLSTTTAGVGERSRQAPGPGRSGRSGRSVRSGQVRHVQLGGCSGCPGRSSRSGRSGTQVRGSGRSAPPL